MNIKRSKSLVVYGLYGLSFIFLLIIIELGWLLIRTPYAGVAFSLNTGLVEKVEAGSPAEKMGIEEGDQVLGIDGRPRASLHYLYQNLEGTPLPSWRSIWDYFFPQLKEPGDYVRLKFKQAGEEQSIEVALRLERASPYYIVAVRLAPLLVVLVSWGLGVYVLLLSPMGDRRTWVFVLIFQLIMVGILSEISSINGPMWLGRSTYVISWLLVPLGVDFHLGFPVAIQSRPLRRLKNMLYLAAVVGIILHLGLSGETGFFVTYTVRRWFLAGGLLIVPFLLARAYFQKASSQEQRQQIRTVAWGVVVAILILVVFFTLPEVILKQTRPHHLVFLLVLPLAYGYAILRYHLIRLEHYISRAAAYLLVIVILTAAYLGLLWVFRTTQQGTTNWTMLILGAVVAMSFWPLYRRIQQFVNYSLYGGWPNIKEQMQEFSQELYEARDTASMAQALRNAVETALQLTCACAVLADDGEEGPRPDVKPLSIEACRQHGDGAWRLDRGSELYAHFEGRPEPIEADRLRQQLAGRTLTPAEAQWLGCQEARWWVPLLGREQVLGAIMLGPRRGGGDLNADDMRILDMITRQGSLAIENMRLVQDLRQLYQQIVSAGEKERAELARRLHDQPLQELYRLNLALDGLQRSLDGAEQAYVTQLEQTVSTIMRDLREVCANLRPPELDGDLANSVRHCVNQVRKRASFEITLDLPDSPGPELPQSIKVCLYRVLQEALTNVQKHAEATQVHVCLCVTGDRVKLSVEDDGKGFDVPQRITQLMSAEHFGLAGARERLESIKGTLQIHSAPGQGTQITASVPWNPAQGKMAFEEGQYAYDYGRRR